jgi:general L-amino acid transport system ATP-binding protein
LIGRKRLASVLTLIAGLMRCSNHLRKTLAADGMTMVRVTHEVGFARKIADRVIFLDQGQIVEENAPKQFFEAPESALTQNFLKQVLVH